MKFELKTENEYYSKSILHFFGIVSLITLIIILCDVALKLGIISRNHKIEYNCRRLSVEKSENFKVTAVAIAAIKCPQHIVK